jgi:hypothetical protein
LWKPDTASDFGHIPLWSKSDTPSSRIMFPWLAERPITPNHWSQDELVVAVRKWVRLEGWPPMQRDWRPVRLGGAERWEAEFPDWPPSRASTVVFGGWSQMLKAAGIQAKAPGWAPEEILAALRAYALEFGRPPARVDLEPPPIGYPTVKAIERRFGSFSAGMRAAGMEPRRKQNWSQDATIEAMHKFKRKNNRWPKSTDWIAAGKDWPSRGTVHNKFGTWQAAVDRAAE